MKNLIITATVVLLSINNYAQIHKTQILVLGSDHLSQVYQEGFSNTDVLSDEGQSSISKFNQQITQFNPDMIGIEVIPDEQSRVDSIYQLFISEKT